MAIKNTIRAEQVKAGQAIFINFRAAYAVAVEQQGDSGLFRIKWYDAHTGDGFIRDNLLSDNAMVPALPDGVRWPSPLAMSERLLEWQRRGLQYTATGHPYSCPFLLILRLKSETHRYVCI